MALFVDGPVSTAGDLAQVDGGLLDAAASHSINVTSKLELAHDSLASDIQLWLDRFRSPDRLFVAGSVTGYRLEQVVVSDSIRHWERMQALALVYRDAWFADLAERYRVRWDEYAKQSRDAYERFVASGLALVGDPLKKAAPPALTTFAGPQRGGSFYAAVAWINAAGQEGAASEISSLDVPDGQIMVVTAGAAPTNATGYNVYVGTTLGTLTQRNDIPLPVTSSFTYIPGNAASTRQPGNGQAPDFIRPLRRTLLRG